MPIIKSEYIRRKLSYIKSIVEDNTKQKLYDINTSAEYIFMQILNDVYGWSLINANEEKPNFPAIDLIDTVNKTVFQVTSNTSPNKVRKETIDKFNKLVKQDEYKKYAHYKIKMFYIKNKPNFSDKILEEFERKGVPKSHLYGIEDINREVSSNPTIATKVFKTICEIFHDKVCNSDISPQLTTKLGKSTIKGRKKELQEIKQYLNSSKALLIHGIGGIGKSTIASYYLHQHKNEFDYYGFFEGLDDFLNKLEIAFKIKVEQGQDRLAVVLHELTKLEGNKLLVIDNIQEVTENKKIIEKILDLKEHDGFKILLTSREEIDGIDKYLLDTLSMDDAKELFHSIYQVEEEVLLEEILEYLDCHAFFVEITAKTLKSKKTLTPEIIKEKFKNGEFSTIKRKRKESFNDYLNQLFSFDRLDNEEMLILKQLSVLPSIEIEFSELEYLLNMNKQNNDEEFTILTKKDSEYFEEILQYLSEKGWISYTRTYYKLHQIIKEYILSFHKPTFKEIEIILDTCGGYLIGVDDIEIAINLKEKIKYFETLYKLLELIVVENKKVAYFLSNLGQLYHHIANYQKAKIFYIRALDIYFKVFGENHFETARVYNNLANLYMNMGIYKEAEFFYLKSLKIRKNIFRLSNLEIANSYSNLAELYRQKGEYTKSEELNLKALNILDDKNIDKATVYNNLAGTYMERNYYNKAESLYKKSINIREKLQGINHPDIATNYSNLGLLYYYIKQYNKAKPLYEKALKIRKEILGINHPETASSYNNIALLYEALGDNKKAEIYYLKDLTINERVLGLEHPHTIQSYYNFSFFLCDKKSFKKALVYILKLIEIIKKIVTSKHPILIHANQCLNTIYNNLDKETTSIQIGRNDPCPCNSGKKYKKCCGKPK